MLSQDTDKWKQFCAKRGFDPLGQNVNNILDFLIFLFAQGAGDSALNVAHSVVSQTFSLGAFCCSLVA